MNDFVVKDFGSKMPKSERLVLRLLTDSKSLTQEEIAEKTKLSERTVKYALKALVSGKLVFENASFCDMRRKNYSIKGGVKI